MSKEEICDLVRVKYHCKERAWAVCESIEGITIMANFLYKGTARPLHWKDGEVVDNIDGVPVVFRRMDMMLGGDE